MEQRKGKVDVAPGSPEASAGGEKWPQGLEAPEVETNVPIDDAVRTYLREIGRVPLLSEEQERALGNDLHQGNREIARAVRSLHARIRQLLVQREPALVDEAAAAWVRVRGGVVWAAVALAVDSRFWRATAVARRRDGLLVQLLLGRTLTALVGRAFLLAVDGFSTYVTAARALVRIPAYTGRRGRPRLVWPEGFALAQVVKAGLHRGEGIVRRVAVGTDATGAAALAASHGGASINTAYSERR